MSRVLGLIAIAISSSWAAQTADPATNELIQKLLARIDGLEKRVAELEKVNPAVTTAVAPHLPAAAPATANSMPAPQATHQAHDQVPPQTAGPEGHPVYPSLKIAGFSDLDFSDHQPPQRGHRLWRTDAGAAPQRV